ncbi:MAG: hypothetical protein IIY55_07935 [Blautia sp.]|nr:hypothetical protein [Blautia sp.]
MQERMERKKNREREENRIRPFCINRFLPGSMTVFLALLLGGMTTLVCAGMLSVRMAGARTQIQNGVDIGLFSVFGEYDRELLERFDVLFLDAGGEGGLELSSVYNEFRRYMDPVLTQNYQTLVPGRGGFTGYRLAVDYQGEPFFQQAAAYMKELYAQNKAKRPQEKLDSAAAAELCEKGEQLEQENYLQRYQEEITKAEQESIRKAAENLENDTLLTDGNTRTEVTAGEMLDPLQPVISFRETQGEQLLLPDTAGNTPGQNPSGSLLSGRSLNQGMEIPDGFLPDDSAESIDLFDAYIMEKMHSLEESAPSFPAFQIEYILWGEEEDLQNIRKTARRILHFREGVNLETMLAERPLRESISRLADSVCDSYLVKPDRSLVEQAVRYTWVYAESLLETRLLFSGQTLPLRKTASNMLLSLEQLETMPGLLAPPGSFWGGTADGISYREILYVFLRKMDKQDKVIRTMDVVEQEMRLEDPSFCLDACICDAEVFVNVKANLRQNFEIRRIYGYSSREP